MERQQPSRASLGESERKKPAGDRDLNQADEEIRTLDPLLGKEMLYH